MEERLTEHKLKTVIDGKLSRFIQTVFQRSAHQKFHAKVVDTLRALRLPLFVKFLPFFQHDIADAWKKD